MYKLVFFAPPESVEQVKQAIFDTGAGKIGNYSHCCWQMLGTGQFKPLEGSDPFIGDEEKVSLVEEYRVELVCEKTLIQSAVDALKRSHPYEEPAYDVCKLENF